MEQKHVLWHGTSETAPNACQQVSKNSEETGQIPVCSYYVPVSISRNPTVQFVLQCVAVIAVCSSNHHRHETQEF